MCIGWCRSAGCTFEGCGFAMMMLFQRAATSRVTASRAATSTAAASRAVTSRVAASRAAASATMELLRGFCYPRGLWLHGLKIKVRLNFRCTFEDYGFAIMMLFRRAATSRVTASRDATSRAATSSAATSMMVVTAATSILQKLKIDGLERSVHQRIIGLKVYRNLNIYK